jgi:hypothetical protein
MKKLRLNKEWISKGGTSFPAGTVIGLHDLKAAELVAAGYGEIVPQDTRLYRYPVAAPVADNCFAEVAAHIDEGEIMDKQTPKQTSISKFFNKINIKSHAEYWNHSR